MKTLNGITVIGVYGLFYQKDGILNSNAMAIWIRCERDIGARFIGAPDGMHLICDEAFPWPFDMQGDGSYILADLSHIYPWSLICAKQLAELEAVNSKDSGKAIGVGLRCREDASFLYIINLGDELRTFDSLPEKILIEENAEVKALGRTGTRTSGVSYL